MALPIAVKLRLPLVVSFLGTDVTLHDQYGRRLHWSHRLYLLRRKRLSDLLTAAIVPSEFLREAIIAQGFPEHRIHIIAHGVDLTRFVPGERTAIEAGKVLYVGRLVERKGLHLLIDALEQARQALPTITLTVIGDGPMRSEFEARALAKLGEGFEFLGAQPQDIVHEHLRSAQVFAMPSITMPNGEVETFGLVYAEAQAMRVPVVAFASGGISEVVAHGETGFLAPEGDIRELAGYIQQLMVEPDLCGKMGDAGRRRVERLFDLDKQNAKLEALYDELRPPA
jgi:glycosyltransferase involved in cell wall biosynthesis